MFKALFSLRLPTITFLVIFAGLYPHHRLQAYHRRHGHSYNYSAIRQRQQQTVIQAALAQRNAAQQVLAAAQATGGGAQDKLNSALSKLRDEAQKFHDSQSTTRQAAKELAEIEEDILDEQAADSPYKQGLKKVEEARRNVQQAEDRIVAEPAVQAKLAGLSGNNLQEAKNKIFEFDDNYQTAKGELSAQGSASAKIRTELFQADKHWKEAAESLTQARKEEKEAEGNTHGGTSGRVGLNLKAKSAGEAAATAKAAIAQAEAVLRANGAGNLINNNSSANNSRSGKKSNK
ncbi:MAG TPA: hypothetical protein VGI40_15770 [Pirellulaceae bacterium]